METKAIYVCVFLQMFLVEIYCRQTTDMNHSLSGMKQTSLAKSKPCPSEVHAGGTGFCLQETYGPGANLKLIPKLA